jgi:hypothetical protein
MHLLGVLGMFLGALALLAFSVIGVWRDLLQITHDAPLLVEDDGLAWSSRYRGAATIAPSITQDGRMASRQ